jgi:NAD(P)-dependent dehydrogenase (short-subunit alcohol dehydrogenase family)
MAGTIIITGANGSVAIHTVQHLLTKTPDNALVLTVRNTSDSDPNTKRLRETVNGFPSAKVSIRQLDLASLKAVNEFADGVAADVAAEKLPPLVGIVCNAYYWNMVADPELTEDGLEKTIQVNHVSHAALVLRLLGSFGAQGGRLVLFTSDSHFPGRNGLEKYPPGIPDDLNKLVTAGPEADKQGRGFENYANSKLAGLMWTYALNRHLQKVGPISSPTPNLSLFFVELGESTSLIDRPG